MEDESEINNIIIFDDMGAYLRNNDTKQLLKEWLWIEGIIIYVYFLCQVYKSLKPDVRKLFSNTFLFKVSKKRGKILWM